MRESQLIVLADREVESLTAENNHCAAAVMQGLRDALSARLQADFRQRQAREREALDAVQRPPAVYRAGEHMAVQVVTEREDGA